MHTRCVRQDAAGAGCCGRSEPSDRTRTADPPFRSGTSWATIPPSKPGPAAAGARTCRQGRFSGILGMGRARVNENRASAGLAFYRIVW